MIFSVSFLYHPLLFSFLVQRKAVPVPLEALALLPVNFFSLLVQRALNLNRHNTTRLFILSVALCFYRTRGSRKQNRGLSSFASFSQPAPQDPTRRVSYPWTDTLITKHRGADVIQTGHQVAPIFFVWYIPLKWVDSRGPTWAIFYIFQARRITQLSGINSCENVDVLGFYSSYSKLTILNWKP